MLVKADGTARSLKAGVLRSWRMARDVIIAGGGVIGCSIALKLATRGVKVTLIERGKIGCEASRAAAGMLSPQSETESPGPFFDLCLRSRSMYPDLAAQVAELSGIDPRYRSEGTLCVSLDENDEKEHERWASWQIGAGLPLEAISSDALLKLEHALAKSARGGLLIPGDHQIDNRRLMDALAIAIKRLGVEVIEGEEVESLAVDGCKATGVVSGGRRLNAGAVVVAAGCWSGRLVEAAGLHIEVVPARGQMLALEAGEALLSHVVYSLGAYLVPRWDNRILIGSTVEYVGYRKGITANAVRKLLEAAVRVVPALGEFELVESWSGLRPDTPDHLPVLGPSSVENLLLATGHFRSGILLAPVTAELLSALIITGRVPVEMEPFSPARFGAIEKNTPAEVL